MQQMSYGSMALLSTIAFFIGSAALGILTNTGIDFLQLVLEGMIVGFLGGIIIAALYNGGFNRAIRLEMK